MRLRRKQTDQLPARPEDAGMSARVLSQILEASTRVQAPAVRAYVSRLRNSTPNATPADIGTKLQKHYLAAVMASGAAVGSAAAFPGIGTLAALSAVAAFSSAIRVSTEPRSASILPSVLAEMAKSSRSSWKYSTASDARWTWAIVAGSNEPG